MYPLILILFILLDCALNGLSQIYYPLPDYPQLSNLKEQTNQPPYGTPFVQSTWSTWEVKDIHFEEGMPQKRVIQIMGEDYERYDVIDIHYRRGRIMSGFIGAYTQYKSNLEPAHVLKWTYKDASHYVYEAWFLFLDKNDTLRKIFLRKKPLEIIGQ